jgi:hypothetical protein
MKFKSLTIAALIITSALGARAASLPTTVTENISIQLTGGELGTPSTNKSGTVTTPVVTKTISTKDVIQALGGSATAQLLLVQQISYTTNTTYTTNHGKITTNTFIVGESGNTEIVLRDGGKDTIVTNITTHDLSTNVSPSVASSVVSSTGLVESKITYKITQFVLRTAALDFTVGGLSVSTRNSSVIRGNANAVIFYNTTSAGPAPSNLSGTFRTGSATADVGVCTGTIKAQLQSIK